MGNDRRPLESDLRHAGRGRSASRCQGTLLGFYAREIPAELYESPWHLLIIVVLSIFIAETAIMGLLYFLFPLPRILWNVPNPQLVIFLLVPATLSVILFPSLVFFVLKPLRRNIRERRLVEQSLEKQEKNFRSLAENSPDIIIRFDRQLRYCYANPVAERLLGNSAAAMTGKTDRELGMADDLAESWEKEIALVFATGRPACLELPYPAHGALLFEARLVPETSNDGSVNSVLVICRDITERKKTEAELRNSREQLRAFSSHLQTAREEERTKIAREIHDELGQVLAAMALDISWLESELPEEMTELREKAAAMADLTRSTIKTVQRVSSELRPVMLEDLGLAAAVNWQVREFQKRTGIDCSVQISLSGDGPDRDRSTALFRILQESLTNVLRHAEATRVSVRLTETADGLVLEITDNGRGITRKAIADRHSLGILGMRERAIFWGGEVEIRGLRKRGTKVTATLPFEQGAEPLPAPVEEDFWESAWLKGDIPPQREWAAV